MPVVCPRGRASLVHLIAGIVLTCVGPSFVLGGNNAFCNHQPRTYRIAPLVIHTDLSASGTVALARRTKAVLADAAAYWKRPLRGSIECFVIDDPDQWEDGSLPCPSARLIIARIGGATHARLVGHGIHSRNVARVFASAVPGVVEHEVVHAYCGQTFGATGPVWYQEGMAQLFAFGCDRRQGVNCPTAMLAQLKSIPRLTVAQIRSGGHATRQMIRQFSDKTHRCAGLAGLIPTTDWNREDVRVLQEIKQFYCWNWFLCHFLYHNRNYCSRFRKVGQAYLAQRRECFSAMFQPVERQLLFEYGFTLDHLVKGYRVDLCSWDWDKPFHRLSTGKSTRVRIVAARGYQATGVQVDAGKRYEYRTSGSWSCMPVSTNGTGTASLASDECLEAVIMHDYQLSTPVVLDCHCAGHFRASCSGQLYVRCRDRWDSLADNQGSVLLTLAQ